MVGRLIVNRMETNQHESNKKAVSPVRSIQHVSHQHTGDIGASLQEEYFLYNLFKGCKRVTVRAAQSCGRAQMRLRRIFPGFRRLEPTSRSCCWTRSSSWHWQAPGFGFELNRSLICLKRQHLWTLKWALHHLNTFLFGLCWCRSPVTYSYTEKIISRLDSKSNVSAIKTLELHQRLKMI